MAGELDRFLGIDAGDEFAREIDEHRQSIFKQNMVEAERTNSDEFSKVVNLSKKRNLPQSAVASNLPEVERKDRLNEYDKIVADSPALKEWLTASPENAKVAHDDLENMGFFEGIWKELQDLKFRPKDVFVKAPAGEVIKTPGTMLAGLGDINDAAAAALIEGIRTIGLESAAEFLEKPRAIPWWVNPSEILRQPGQQLIKAGESVGVPEERRNILTEITGVAGQVTSQALLYSLNPAASVAGLYGQGAYIGAREATEAGASNVDKSTATLAYGAVTTLTEKYGLDLLLNRVPPAIKNRVLRALADKVIAGGIEASQEVVEGYFHNVIASMTFDPERRLTQGLDREALVAGGGAALVRTLLGGGRGTAELYNNYRKAQHAKLNEQTIEALGESAKASKVREKLPEKYKDFVRTVKSRGKVDNVYIPADKFVEYFQGKDIDPVEEARKISPEVADNMAESIALGEDVAIPLEDFQTYIAATEHLAGLSKDIRFHHDDMTAREAEEFEKANLEELEGFFQNVTEETEASQTRLNLYDTIKQDMKNKFIEAGQSDKVSDQISSLFAARVITRAERLGVTPEELLAEREVIVRSEVLERLRERPVTELDLMIDRLKAERIPTDRDISGQTLVEFLRDKGGLQDAGGELAAREIPTRRGQRKLIQEQGLSLDDAAQAAQEAGYFPGEERPTINDLLDAIDKEVRGEPVFAAAFGIDERLAIEKADLEELGRIIEEAGLDIQEATNEEIKAALGETDVTRPVVDEGVEFEQRIPAKTSGTIENAELTKQVIDTAKSIEAKLGLQSFNVFLSNKGDIKLDQIIVPKDKRKTGIGTQALEELVAFADSVGRRVTLTPATKDDAHGTTSRARLIKFYKRFGFIENKGRNKDFAISDGMYRDPKEVSFTSSGVARQIGRELFQKKDKILDKENIYSVDEYIKAPPRRINIDTLKEINKLGIENSKLGKFQAYHTPVYQMAYDLGQQGQDISDLKAIKGIRFGPSPEFGVSRNVRDDISEKGLSLAQKHGGKMIGSAIFFKDRLAYEYEGIEVDSGSDGEPIILPLHVEDLDFESEFFQKKQPIFFSKLEHVIIDKVQKKASSQDVLNLIKKGDVKSEELKWSGIEDYLKGKKTVTKDEVLEFLRANRIEVTEVEKGRSDIKDRILEADALKSEANRAFRAAADATDLSRIDIANIILGDDTGASKALESLEIGDEETREAARSMWDAGSQMNAILEEERAGRDVETKFSEYTLPGGENYKELLLTLPIAPGVAARETFKSSHFDEPNILAHVRFNERTDSEGNKVLFLEEVQSDWALEARKKGVKLTSLDIRKIADKHYDLVDNTGRVADSITEDTYSGPWDKASLERVRDRALKTAKLDTSRVPDAPFIQKNWTELALKRMLRYAAENDFDKMAWISGEQTADRYDLSKQIDTVDYKETASQLVAKDKDGNEVIKEYGVNRADLERYVGKELGQRLIDKGKQEGLIGHYRLEGTDLKVGGEWAFTLYDKVIPNFLKKYGKKWGAKVEETKLPEIGEEQSIPITDEMKQAVLEVGQPLFQAAGPIRAGSILLTDQQAVITLFEEQDLSTALHEFGHLFIDELSRDAALPGAPQQIKDDFQTILDFVGAKSAEELNPNTHGEDAVEKQEKLAMAFEAYLREGKAPSVQLQSAFQSFKAWLKRVYETILNLGVEINDEIRTVFDRMIATDQEIEDAEAFHKFKPVFNNADIISQEELDRLNLAAEKATRAAEDDLLKEAMKEVAREKTKAWKEERERTRTQVESEINQQPVYQAFHYLTTGEALVGELPEGHVPYRLSREALVDTYGKEILRRLPKGKKTVYEPGGIDPDVIAEQYRFTSGDEMVRAFLRMQPRKDVIENETTIRMKEKHGDMMVDGRIEQEAIDSIHSDARASFMHVQLKALSKRAGLEVTPKQVLKQAATRIVAGRKIKNLHLGRVANAEIRASKELLRTATSGDFQAAVNAQYTQLLQHYIYMETRKVKDEVTRGVKRVKQYNKTSTREKIGKSGHDYLEKIDGILNNFEFRLSLRKLEKLKGYKDWAEAQREAGNFIDIPDGYFDGADKKHYRELTIDEFRGIQDALENIKTVALNKNRLLTDREKRLLEDAVSELVDSINGNWRGKRKPPYLDKSDFEKKKDIVVKSYSLRKFESWARELDGYKPEGPMQSLVFRTISKATDDYELKTQEFAGAFRDIFEGFTTKEFRNATNKRQYYAEVDASLTRSSLWMIALHYGNKEGRERLTTGFNWSQDQIESLLENLNENEWKSVDKVWKYLESRWPETAELDKRTKGVVPERVQAIPIVTKFGSFDGGYFPLKYSKALSDKAVTHEAEQLYKDLKRGMMGRLGTRKGRTIKRLETVGSDLKLRLDLDVLFEHVQETNHDTSYREALHDVEKIINHPRFTDAVRNTAGDVRLDMIREWLQDAVIGDIVKPVKFGELFFGHVRRRTTFMTMGWKLSTALVQPLGYTQSMARFIQDAGSVKEGLYYSIKGVNNFFGSPAKMKEKYDFVMENSKMMKTRLTNYDREVHDSLKRLKKGRLLDEYERSLFLHIAKMQMLVDMPTWLGAYEYALDTFAAQDTKKAAAHADSVVRLTQGSGINIDLSPIQRGGETQRILNMYMTFFNTTHNMLVDEFKLTQRAGSKRIGQLVFNIFLMTFIPSVLHEGLYAAAGVGGPEDDEDWATWALKNWGLFMMAPYPVVRDIVSNVVGGFPYQISPVQGSMKEVSKLAAQIKQGEADAALARSLVKTIGLAPGVPPIPSNQLLLTGEYFYDFLNGTTDEFSLVEAFVKKNYKANR